MSTHRKTGKKRGGFTLVEILVVVGILALLAAIAIPNLLRGRLASNDAMAKSTLKTIASALENYMIVSGTYPTSTDSLIGVTPPYLNKNYFVGTHAGFGYSSSISDYAYTVTATPAEVGTTGTKAFLISTGSVLQE